MLPILPTAIHNTISSEAVPLNPNFCSSVPPFLLLISHPCPHLSIHALTYPLLRYLIAVILYADSWYLHTFPMPFPLPYLSHCPNLALVILSRHVSPNFLWFFGGVGNNGAKGKAEVKTSSASPIHKDLLPHALSKCPNSRTSRIY